MDSLEEAGNLIPRDTFQIKLENWLRMNISRSFMDYEPESAVVKAICRGREFKCLLMI